MNLFRRLGTFDDDVNFRKGWRIAGSISAVVVLIGLVSLLTAGLNLGIDFKGGTGWVFPANNTSTKQIQSAVKSAGVTDATVQRLELDGHVSIRVEVGTEANINKVALAMAKASNQSVDIVNANRNEVGPSWGRDVSQKALRALIVFFIVIALYITWKLEWRMAVGALVAVLHDIIVSVGLYSVFQFPVTPGTVVAFLTILGYSLYDTIVVYDKVRDNQSKVTMQGDITYSDMINLSLNQAFMRSINTTISTILPVLSILIIGSLVMGAVTLQEFGLALLIGMIVGAYSSVFVAPPVVVWLKNREPRNMKINERVKANRAKNIAPGDAPAARDAINDEVDGDGEAEGGGVPVVRRSTDNAVTSPYSPKHPPRPRKQGKRR